MPNNTQHRTAFPLCSKAAGDRSRSENKTGAHGPGFHFRQEAQRFLKAA
jgi:hypothetical protein